MLCLSACLVVAILAQQRAILLVIPLFPKRARAAVARCNELCLAFPFCGASRDRLFSAVASLIAPIQMAYLAGECLQMYTLFVV